MEAVRKIKKNDNIIITKPDKGSGIAVMDRDDYKNRMILLKMNQNLKSAVSDFDLFKIETKINDTLKGLVSSEELSQAIVNELKLYVGSMRSILYGLPKLHKTHKPLRHILSMNNSSQHGLTKFLNIMLEPVITYFSKFVGKYSFEVVRTIRGISAEDTIVSSFDVKKLFSSVT